MIEKIDVVEAVNLEADGDSAVHGTLHFGADADFPAPFDRPFYLILNVAVGGWFPGPPDATSDFPAAMEVDWIRVYSGVP